MLDDKLQRSRDSEFKLQLEAVVVGRRRLREFVESGASRIARRASLLEQLLTRHLVQVLLEKNLFSFCFFAASIISIVSH